MRPPTLDAPGAAPRAWSRSAQLPTHRLVADQAYSSRAIRRYAHRRNIRVTIPHKRNESQAGPFDRASYRKRNRIERAFNRFKQCRRLATRYEKRAHNYRAMWVVASILLWFRL